jgi:ATP-dependent DNA helicase RecG
VGEITPTAQVTAQVTGEVQRLLGALVGEMSRQQLLDALGMTHREHFRSAFLKPALDAGVVEMTLPDKPKSRHQRSGMNPTPFFAMKPRD